MHVRIDGDKLVDIHGFIAMTRAGRCSAYSSSTSSRAIAQHGPLIQRSFVGDFVRVD